MNTRDAKNSVVVTISPVDIRHLLFVDLVHSLSKVAPNLLQALDRL